MSEQEIGGRTRSKLRKGSFCIAAVNVLCPSCQDCLSEPGTGSHLWESKQIPASDQPVFLICDCGQSVYICRPVWANLKNE